MKCVIMRNITIMCMLSKQLVNEYMNIFPVLCKSLEFNPIIMSKITQHLCINKVIPKKRLAENLA